MGERLLRKLQLEAPRRDVEHRGLLIAQRGKGAHRRVAAPLQHREATFVAGLQTARSKGLPVAGSATPASSAGHPSLGASPNHPLTSNPDHLMGAGHLPPVIGPR